MIIGNRIPHTFFETKGKGESDHTVHAGSYHVALRDAGIEMCNIMTYSSILPKEAVKIPYCGHSLHHGSVMECILSVAHGQAGEHIAAGLIYGWLYDGAEKVGGLVCEINEPLYEIDMKAKLCAVLEDMHKDGYGDFDLRDLRCLYQDLVVTKKHGSALVGLCFTSYLVNVTC